MRVHGMHICLANKNHVLKRDLRTISVIGVHYSQIDLEGNGILLLLFSICRISLKVNYLMPLKSLLDSQHLQVGEYPVVGEICSMIHCCKIHLQRPQRLLMSTLYFLSAIYSWLAFLRGESKTFYTSAPYRKHLIIANKQIILNQKEASR